MCHIKTGRTFREMNLKDYTNMSNVHTLEVVACGSETQLQVGEKLNKLNF